MLILSALFLFLQSENRSFRGSLLPLFRVCRGSSPNINQSQKPSMSFSAKKRSLPVASDSPYQPDDTGGAMDLKSGTKKETRSPFPRDNIEPISIVDCCGHKISIISWNIPGLRTATKKCSHIIEKLLRQRRPDILCLQETKLQASHVEEQAAVFEKLGYTGFWACSQVRKGYAGTAVLIKKDSIIEVPTNLKKSKQTDLAKSWGIADNNNKKSKSDGDLKTSIECKVVSVSYDDIDDAQFSGEGRVITLELDSFFLVACYVPNSGQDLARLDFRVNSWDECVRSYLRKLRDDKGKPVVFVGDLNVAHLDIDIYNAGAKHLIKQAGTTPQERESFSRLLASGFSDAFRVFYPNALGQFTYWSQRTFARAVNCGLRLDYFVCSDNMFGSPSLTSSSPSSVGVPDQRVETLNVPTPGVLDCCTLPFDTDGCSDHCPIMLVLQV